MQMKLIRELLFEYSLEDLYKKPEYINMITNNEKNTFSQFLEAIGINYNLYDKVKNSDNNILLRTFDSVADMYAMAYKEYGEENLDNLVAKVTDNNFNDCLDSFSKYMSEHHINFWDKQDCIIDNDMNLYIPKKLECQTSNIIVGIFYRPR